jgi:hypothetical protein
MNKRNLLKMIRNFKFESYKPLTLENFLEHYKLEPYHIYKSYRFYELLCGEGVIDDYNVPDIKEFKQALRRITHINAIKWIEFILRFLKKENPSVDELANDEKTMLLMFHYTIANDCPNGELVSGINKLKTQNEWLLKEMIELLEYNRKHIDVKEKLIKLPYDLPLELFAKYTVDHVLASMGVHTIDRKMPFREGVIYVEDKKTDIFFITINKYERNFSETTLYEDYAISETLFHWQSQSRTSDTSPTGQRYINQRTNGNTVLLFVREYKTENGINAPFYFLGKANYVSHKGSKPISLIWELEEKMPTLIHKKSNRSVS